jgi:PBP1b-binding outer membrane lipoprotein LpoB
MAKLTFILSVPVIALVLQGCASDQPHTTTTTTTSRSSQSVTPVQQSKAPTNTQTSMMPRGGM